MIRKLFTTLLDELNSMKNECDCNETCKCKDCEEDMDILSEEGYEKAKEAFKEIKESPIGKILMSLVDIDDLESAMDALYEEYHKDEDEDFYDDLDNEFDNPLRYSERIPEDQLRTIKTVAEEFLGEMITNAEHDYSEEDENYIRQMLIEFGAFVMLR